jgi:hypothetical protein
MSNPVGTKDYLLKCRVDNGQKIMAVLKRFVKLNELREAIPCDDTDPLRRSLSEIEVIALALIDELSMEV